MPPQRSPLLRPALEVGCWATRRSARRAIPLPWPSRARGELAAAPTDSGLGRSRHSRGVRADGRGPVSPIRGSGLSGWLHLARARTSQPGRWRRRSLAHPLGGPRIRHWFIVQILAIRRHWVATVNLALSLTAVALAIFEGVEAGTRVMHVELINLFNPTALWAGYFVFLGGAVLAAGCTGVLFLLPRGGSRARTEERWGRREEVEGST